MHQFVNQLIETMAAKSWSVGKLPHHEQQELCMTRPKYRQGRKFTAVKVYTVSSESAHLLIFGVPALGLRDEVKKLCQRYGDVAAIAPSPREDDELFTDTFHVQYVRVVSARYGKRQMDNRNFYGGLLHVCYAPEFETVAETREKLAQRRRDVAKRLKQYGGSSAQQTDTRKDPAAASRTLNVHTPQAPCVWAGAAYTCDPRTLVPNPIVPSQAIIQPFGPQLPDEEWIRAGVRERRIVASHPGVLRTAPATRNPPTSGPVPPSLQHLQTPGAPSSVPSSRKYEATFVPRQVGVKRVVFKKSQKKDEHKDGHNSPQSGGDADQAVTAPPLKRAADEQSQTAMEPTASLVCKKIKAVDAPDVPTVLNEKEVC
ncbi:RNA-binding protein 48 isoform X1 [Schistocerca nitens]|uniref:RNA-binding protein 48 isoform X1 n=1 Tax=Schistocerca nitens TaxID=7011 RepID=UPI00211994FA|nr:RNA-binding protein 48 isoform X1 [Schistocerca nitens]